MLLRRSLQCVSWLALASTILPSCLYLTGYLAPDPMKTAMLAATVGWFVATPFWVHRKPDDASAA